MPGEGGGYGTGIDPISGQRRDGGMTGRGIGAGIGSSAGKPGHNPEALRSTLHENGLPQGGALSPMSGYVYFAVPPKKNAKYQLEYLLNGKQVVLALH